MHPASSAGDGPAPTGLHRHATIDAAVLRRNIGQLADSGAAVDARADGYGHGLATVVRSALAAGVTVIRVSTQEEAATVTTIGAVPTRDGANDLGLGIYGFDGEHERAMTLRSELVAVKAVAAGTGVSYGYTFRAAEPTSLGLVPLGYADGIPRLTSNHAFVSIAGTRHPIVGRIAMDQLVVDLGASIAHVGDPVVLFGAAAHGHPSVLDWAQAARRSPADVTAGLGRRILRSTTGADERGDSE